MSPEELEEEGIQGFRNKLACSLKDLGVGYTTAFVVILYLLYTYTWLAIEKEIYESDTATKILEIAEIVIVACFTLEILAFIISYGPKLYFSDLFNIAEILIILALIIAIVLDLIDSSQLRVEGFLRCLRVTLIFLRVRIMVLLFHERKRHYSKYDTKDGVQKANQILTSLRDRITQVQIKADVNYGIRILNNPGLAKKDKKSIEDKKQDSLHWARDNSVKLNSSRALLEKERLSKRISEENAWKYFEINSSAQRILLEVEDFDFDIFALRRETNGNEMIAGATHLLFKNGLFEKLMIDP